ncbi:MAG: InlB B-repeat-containing protein [Bifidobacteriaceae bacterium]|nr:InlB B-repeat-containing protein [Bifidobacteriaceae bacterium]
MVPVTITYSEPVSNPAITVDDGAAGTPLPLAESADTLATTHTFLYTVPEDPADRIAIKAWSATEILGDQASGGFDGASMSIDGDDGVTFSRAPVWSAITGVTLSKDGQYGPGKETGATLTVTVAPTSAAFQDWAAELGAHDDVSQSVAFSLDGGATRLPLTYQGTDAATGATTLTGTFDVPPTTEGRTGRVELYGTEAADPGAADAAWRLILGADTYADYHVTGAILFTDPSQLGIAEPADGWDRDKRIIYAGPDEAPVTFSPDIVLTTATFQGPEDFTWSLDPVDATNPPGVEIATIDAGGVLTPTGQGDGRVRVVLTATNGGIGDPLVVKGTAIDVKVGGTPYIAVPGAKGTLTLTQGQALRFAWSSNATLLASRLDEPYVAQYRVTVYRGDWTVEQMASGQAGSPMTPAVTTADLTTTVPAGTLTDLSRGGKAAYSYLLQTDNPTDRTQTLSAGGGIVVLAPAATVQVDTDAGSRYILDNHGPVHVTWTLEHFDPANAAEFEFTVTTPNGPVDGSEVTFEPGSDGQDGTFRNPAGHTVGWATATGGAYTLDPAVIGGDDLKTAYTVQIKAKNASDSTYSYASTQLWVYDHTALDILVDGTKPAGGKVALSNRGWVTEEAARSGTALRDTVLAAYDSDRLNLRAAVSANYGDHAWEMVADQLAWNSSDQHTATLNQRHGQMYANIDNSTTKTFAPDTELLLSGVNSGQTTITATHARTGMAASIDVNVDTLAGQLFIFQAYPRTQTAMTYQDQKGASHQATSDTAGRFAIYSPDGVAGDVPFSSKFGGREYRGTLHAQDLRSGEQDSAYGYTYPVNQITLRPIAEVTLHLQQPDGTPFQGRVQLNGGVWVDGTYAPGSQLAARGADHIVTPDALGAVTLTWDITRWGAATGDALRFDYVFEATFPDGGYRPMIVKTSTKSLDTWDVMAASHITVLRDLDGAGPGAPFLGSAQVSTAKDGSDAEDITGSDVRVGPNLDYPTAYLTSTFLWWGGDPAAPDGLSARLLDQGDGTVPAGQSYKSFAYPFSTMPLTEHTERLDASTLWMDKVVSRPIEYDLSDGGDAADGGHVAKTIAPAFTVYNGLAAPVDAPGAARDAKNAVALPSPAGVAPATFSTVNGNQLINQGLTAMSNIKIDTSMFKMFIAPTKDPAVFNYVVQVQIGNMPPDSANVDGGIDWSTLGKSTSNSSGVAVKPVPSPFEAAKMAAGTYMKEAKNTVNEANKSGRASDKGALFQVGGYAEGKIWYDTKLGKWRSRLMGGYEDAGGGFSYQKSWNIMAGPFPMTFSLELGGAVTLSVNWQTLESQATGGQSGFDTAWADPDQEYVRDDLIHLRAMFYVDMFGGLGLDFTVVALKFGLFGTVAVNVNQYWLERTYVKDTSQEMVNGGSVKVTGTFGIRAELKALFIKLKFVVVQVGITFGPWGWGQWENIGAYWKSVTGQDLLEDGVPIYKSKGAKKLAAKDPAAWTPEQTAASKAYSQAYGIEPGTTMLPVNSAALESRDYLTTADRAWTGGAGDGSGGTPAAARTAKGARAAAQPGNPTTIWTNAYPDAAPQLLDDGSGFAYLTDQGSADVYKTRAAFAEADGNGWAEGRILDDAGKGDSSLAVAGDAAFAAAAWVRQTRDPAGDVTASDQTGSIADMSASAEVEAAVRTGDGPWTTTALTANSVGDLAPAVAVGGSKVLVAWRQVATAADSAAVTFDTLDRIVYRVYDAGQWGPLQVAYNGTGGTVKGLTAAVAPSGRTGAIVYTVQKGTDEAATAAVAQVLDLQKDVTEQQAADGVNTIRSDVQVTDDTAAAANPQLTTVSDATGQELFLAAWHTRTAGQDQGGNATTDQDIQLYAFDAADGQPTSLPDSLAAAGAADGVVPTTNFRFARHTSGTLEETALVWADAGSTGAALGQSAGGDAEGSATPDATTTGSLKAVRLTCGPDGRLALAAPVTLATLEEGAVVDSFDAVANDGGTAVTAIMETSRDWRASDGGTGQSETVTDTDGTAIDMPARVATLAQASGRFDDGFDVTGVVPDYTYLHKGATLPVTFTVVNTGPTAIDSLQAVFKDSTTGDYTKAGGTSAGLGLAPGATATLTAHYDIPDGAVESPDWRITASYGAAPAGRTETRGDVLHLDVPEVGIAGSEVTKSEEGEREFLVTLGNETDVPLAGSGRQVRVEFQDDADAATNDAGAAPVPAVTIADDAALQKIDAGVYTLSVPFDLAAYVTDRLGADEIPATGIRIGLTASVLDADGNVLLEANPTNNRASVEFPSLIAQNGGLPQRATAELDNTSGHGSHVAVTLENLSLSPIRGAGVLVTLLDAQGNAIATKKATAAGQPLTLRGEATAHLTADFDQAGARATARYFPDAPTAGPGLAGLGLTGVPGLDFDGGRLDYTVDAQNLARTTLTARAASAGATVDIDYGGRTVGSGTGLAAATVPLAIPTEDGQTADNVLTVRVTTASDTTTTYRVTVQNRLDRATSGLVLGLDAPVTNGWVNAEAAPGDAVAVQARDGAGASGDWQYRALTAQVDGGAPATVPGFTGAAQTVATVAEDGVHTVAVQGKATTGEVYPAEPLPVWVDRTAPTLAEATMTTLAQGVAAGGVTRPSQAGLNPATLAQTDRRVRVTFTAGDGTSGLAGCGLVLDGGRTVPATPGPDGRCEATLAEPYSGDVQAQATDVAGNRTVRDLGHVAIVSELDQAPTETVRVMATDQGSATVQYSAKLNTPGRFVQAQLQLAGPGSNAWTAVATVPKEQEAALAGGLTQVIAPLASATGYRVRLAVTHDEVEVAYSDPVALTTNLKTPATAPRAKAIKLTAIKLRVPASKAKLQYRIAPAGSGAWSAWQYSPTFTKLKPGHRYDVQQRRVQAGLPPSAPSAAATLRTASRATVTFTSVKKGVAVQGLPKAKRVKVGKRVAKPAAPRAQGWRFTGWYKDRTLKHRYGFQKKVTRNLKLYAGWRRA